MYLRPPTPPFEEILLQDRNQLKTYDVLCLSIFLVMTFF